MDSREHDGSAEPRPLVDVIMPFAGPEADLRQALTVLGSLRIRPGDTVTLVDNTPRPIDRPRREEVGTVTVVRDSSIGSSYYARNVGGRLTRNPWIIFIDADVIVPSTLLDDYFVTPPGERTGVLVGGIRDVGPTAGQTRLPPAAQYAYLQSFLDQRGTMEREEFAYAKTANCAIRRTALETEGWFLEGLRSGGDAEICFRLGRAGWILEWRDGATVIHQSRDTVRRLLRQVGKHGSGSQWLEERYPGFSPRGRTVGVLRWSIMCALSACHALLVRDRDRALIQGMNGLTGWAFHLGRFRTNEVAAQRRFRLPR